jgi:hypothetical protein
LELVLKLFIAIRYIKHVFFTSLATALSDWELPHVLNMKIAVPFYISHSMNTRNAESCKDIAVRLQAWIGPVVPRWLRFPDFMTVGT